MVSVWVIDPVDHIWGIDPYFYGPSRHLQSNKCASSSKMGCSGASETGLEALPSQQESAHKGSYKQHF